MLPRYFTKTSITAERAFGNTDTLIVGTAIKDCAEIVGTISFGFNYQTCIVHKELKAQNYTPPIVAT